MKKASKDKKRLERRRAVFDNAAKKDSRFQNLIAMGAVHRPGSVKK